MTFLNDKHIESNQKKVTKSGSTLKNFINTISIVPITQNVSCILEPFRKEPSLRDNNEEPE